MNVLIIIPPLAHKPSIYYNLPMGLLYVASAWRKGGHNVTILNLTEILDGQYDRVIRTKIKNQDLVLTGGLSIQYSIIKHIIGSVKRHSNLPVVVGGGLVSSQPEVVSGLLDADLFVVGEAEGISSSDVIRALHYRPVSGILYARDDVITDVLNTTFPAYDLFNMELYLNLQRPSDGRYRCIVDKPRDAAIIASRGCPYNCTFCYHPTGYKYRQRDLVSVFKEIDTLTNDYAINILSIYDELFSHDKKRLHDFCNPLKGGGLNWSCQLRVDSVDEDDLQLMKESGCYMISFGIESGSDAILKAYKKNITVAKIDKALETCKKVGIGVQGNILIGAETETVETVKQSLDWWEKHHEFRLAITDVIPYPGTEMYCNAIRAGKIDPKAFLEADCPAIKVSNITHDESVEIQKRINNLDDKYRPIAKIVAGVPTGLDDFGRTQYKLNVICPHCKAEVEYKNFALDCSAIVFMCKNCYMRFVFSSAEMEG